MLLVGGTLLAWAVSLRLLSNALFVALAAYVQLWVSLVLGLLHLLRVYQPRHDTHSLQQEAALEHPSPTLQQQQSPFRPPAVAQAPFEQATQHEHIHFWVQSAALAAAHASPPGSTCPSVSSPRPVAPTTAKEPLCQESSSSSMASTGAAVSTAIVQAAAQGMLQVYSMKNTQGKLHVAAPAAVAAWATAALLANRVSESSSCSTLKGRHASTANVCLPPLQYEASAELQKQLDTAAPHEFMCPIGRVLMVDPVFTPSGFTYQRSSILEWIARTGRDPAQDGSPLSPTQLCPNVNLRDQIATWLQQQGVPT